MGYLPHIALESGRWEVIYHPLGLRENYLFSQARIYTAARNLKEGR